VICCANSLFVFAQEGSPTVKDFQTWNSAGVGKSLDKKLKVFLQEEVRLKNNSSQLRTSFTNIGVKWEALKNFNISIVYRLIIKPTKISHRIYTDLSYEWKNKRWSLEPRIRLQHEFIPNDINENYVRPELTLEHKINKHWRPFVSAEFFYHIFYYKEDKFDEYRLSAGVDYNFDKKNSLKLFYLFEQEINTNAPQQNNILGVSYTYNL
jgi:long-subunit fatty acid transport protein